MLTILSAAGLVFAIVAGLIHVAIFALESLLWRSRSTWRQFGIRSAEDAEVARPWALNQGYYNLFLAVGAIAGGIASLAGGAYPWAAVAMFSAICMVGAAVVLAVSSRGALLRGAIIQGLVPLVGVVLFALGFV